MARRRALRQIVFGLAACLALAACTQRATPGSELPAGTLLFGRSAALERLLATAARLEGTPLARHARAFAERLPPCDWVEARAPEPSQLVDALACGDPAGALSALDRERGEHDIAFALPLHGGARVIGSANVAADGSLALSLVLPGDALTGPAAFLLPGPEPAGEPVLSASEQLVHARVRAAKRLDLAAFVPSDSQASRLFRLESALFSGLVLDDTWEAAVYPAATGQHSPRAALALGVRERKAAIAAIEDFVQNLRESWPVHRSAFAIGRASGACLLDLNLLPDLAPCYVATERALVIGWNPASLRKALDGAQAEPIAASELTGAGSLVLDFDRVQEADARLRALAPAGSVLLPQPAYPWRRLRLSGERGRAGVELRLELAAKESA
jgi:hypothetical protein